MNNKTVNHYMPINCNYWYIRDNEQEDQRQHFWYDRREYLADTADLFPQSVAQVHKGDIVLVTKGVNNGCRGKVVGFTRTSRVSLALEDGSQAVAPVASIKLLDPEGILGIVTPYKPHLLNWALRDSEPIRKLPNGRKRVVQSAGAATAGISVVKQE